VIWIPEELESVACDFCGSEESRPVVTRPDGMTAVECTICGLSFLTPRPKKEFIKRLYEANYFVKTKDCVEIPDSGFVNYISPESRLALLRCAEQRLALASRFVNFSSKTCLEIGCATGELCYLLSTCGAHTVGLDVSADIIKYAKARYIGLDFRSGDITSLPEEANYDVIFAFEVIEHVPSPNDFFINIAKRLKPQGLLVITTPNYECAKRGGLKQWSGFSMSFEHLYFFTPETLTKCAAKSGLTMIEWLTGGGSGLLTRDTRVTKKVVSKALNKLHLLSFARKVRNLLFPYRNGYVKQGNFHNIYMVMSKP
jgi:2-polyprenyl-3-methyl-5-hydroxy-6-metoxy-1,4-benzoquinol methylase